MKCHICGAATDMTCQRCERPICSRHLESWLSPAKGSYVQLSECIACAPQTKLRQETASRNGAPYAKVEAGLYELESPQPGDGPASEAIQMQTTSSSKAADKRRLSLKFWLGWLVLGAAVGGALLFTVASAPAIIEESLSSIVLAIAPVVLILAIGGLLGNRLLNDYFGGEARWLAASYFLTMFAVFLGLAAVGVALLLIPLGLRSRIKYVTRWTIACGLGGVLAFIAVLFAPTYLSLGFSSFIILGVTAFALMAAITGIALHSMLYD